jgi:aminopeptidase-like protein
MSDISCEQLVTEDLGEEIFALVAEIYSICRSITGRSVRKRLRALSAHIKLEVHEVASDWAERVNIREA